MSSSPDRVDLNLAALPAMGDALLAEIGRVRDADPLLWSETSQCWIASGHAEVMEGFGGRLPLSNTQMPQVLFRVLPEAELRERIPNSIRYMSLTVQNLDGERHARIRKLASKALNRRLVESLRPYVQSRVESLLSEAATQDDVEFNEGIARMLPGAVILKLLGMDIDRYLQRLKGWADGVTIALTSFSPRIEWLDQLEITVTDMVEVFRQEIADRRQNPRDDLITELINAVDGEARLSEDEMIATLLIVIIAGHDTTVNSLTLGVRALADHPSEWRFWQDHQDQGRACANELMRYIAMSTAMPRIVLEDFEWRGRQLRRGDLVMLMIAGGNRDPSAYSEPEKLDFTRSNDAVLTFGPGLHHCIGHLLAKLQLEEFFGALTQRFKGVEITKAPQFMPTLIFRGMPELRVRFLS